MKQRYRGAFLLALVCCGMVTGCTRPGSSGETSAAQKLSGSFTAEMTMTVDDLAAVGTLSRLGDGVWSASFDEPSTLAGVVLDFTDGEVTASYKGLGFSVPQTAMPAKSVLCQLITVVDTLAQQEQITGEDADGYVSVEGDLDGSPYTLRLTSSGELASFTLDGLDAVLQFEQFQSGVPVATGTEHETAQGDSA